MIKHDLPHTRNIKSTDSFDASKLWSGPTTLSGLDRSRPRSTYSPHSTNLKRISLTALCYVCCIRELTFIGSLRICSHRHSPAAAAASPLSLRNLRKKTNCEKKRVKNKLIIAFLLSLSSAHGTSIYLRPTEQGEIKNLSRSEISKFMLVRRREGVRWCSDFHVACSIEFNLSHSLCSKQKQEKNVHGTAGHTGSSSRRSSENCRMKFMNSCHEFFINKIEELNSYGMKREK